MLAFCEGLSETMFKFVAIVMGFAPIGIGAAIAVTVGASGIGVLVNLLKLVATLYVALIAFVLLVLLPIALIMKVPMQRFLRAIKEPWLIAFTTASSEAALPRAMQAMEAIGVPRRIVAFVMPTGYSFNLDGSTLYLAVASVFAAQAAGIDMSLRDQIMMMLTLMLTSKGVAAVPRASLVILAGALTQFHLPLQAIAVILGVDAIMDMARTSLNVVGNCLATVVMAKWEGVLGTEVEVAIERRGELEGVSPNALNVRREHRPLGQCSRRYMTGRRVVVGHLSCEALSAPGNPRRTKVSRQWITSSIQGGTEGSKGTRNTRLHYRGSAPSKKITGETGDV
jgi:proton glutamate symport protein